MPKMDPKRYDYREVPCSRCGAKTGGYCIRPSGHSGPFVLPHADRKRAAIEAWRAEERARYGRIVSPDLLDERPTTTEPQTTTDLSQGDLFAAL